MSHESHQIPDPEVDKLRNLYPDGQFIVHPLDREPGLQELVFQAESAFRALYEKPPELAAKGSTRLEKLGNFTDKGFGRHAIGFPTNLGIVAAVSAREGRSVQIWSGFKSDEVPLSIDLNNLPMVDNTNHWSHYVIAILHRLKAYSESEDKGELYKSLTGAQFALVSNVPAGTGISTSAAAEAAFINGFLGINNISLPAEHIAAITKHAENDIGSMCGWLDQATSNTRVQKGHGVLLRFKNEGQDGIGYVVEEEVYMDLERHGAQFALVFAPNFSRNLAKTDYNRKANSIQQGSLAIANADGKDVYQLTLADIDEHYDQLAGLDEEQAKLVLHVYSDDVRVIDSVILWRQLKNVEPFTPESQAILEKLGKIINESAQSSMDNYGVSTGIAAMPSFKPLLDSMRACGALGARNEGGGDSLTSYAIVPIKDMKRFSESVPAMMKQIPGMEEVDIMVTVVTPSLPSRVLTRQ